MISHKHSPVSLIEKVDILKKFTIFKDVDDSWIKDFAEKTISVLIPPMEVFVEQDMDEHQAYFVYQGAASVFRTTETGEIINIDLLGW
jgi:hypothetical protein